VVAGEPLTPLERELQQTVRDLQEQNVQLRATASDFGALAERLNIRLAAAEQRRSWMWRSSFGVGLWMAVGRFLSHTSITGQRPSNLA
jgi:hypothetical protein